MGILVVYNTLQQRFRGENNEEDVEVHTLLIALMQLKWPFGQLACNGFSHSNVVRFICMPWCGCFVLIWCFIVDCIYFPLNIIDLVQNNTIQLDRRPSARWIVYRSMLIRNIANFGTRNNTRHRTDFNPTRNLMRNNLATQSSRVGFFFDPAGFGVGCFVPSKTSAAISSNVWAIAFEVSPRDCGYKVVCKGWFFCSLYCLSRVELFVRVCVCVI